MLNNDLKINFIFKASFDKANRSSFNSERGIGLEKSLEIFSEIKNSFNCSILTDVHNERQCEIISKNDIIEKYAPQETGIETIEKPSFAQRFLEKARGNVKGINVDGISNTLMNFGKCCTF